MNLNIFLEISNLSPFNIDEDNSFSIGIVTEDGTNQFFCEVLNTWNSIRESHNQNKDEKEQCITQLTYDQNYNFGTVGLTLNEMCRAVGEWLYFLCANKITIWINDNNETWQYVENVFSNKFLSYLNDHIQIVSPTNHEESIAFSRGLFNAYSEIGMKHDHALDKAKALSRAWKAMNHKW